MSELFRHVLIVLVPLIFTGILHMLAVKENWFAFFRIPIWRTGFGENKTWRGVIVVPLANAVFLAIIASVFELHLAFPFGLGLMLGISYVLFELPNSFLKRKAGIEAGGHHREHKYLFYLLDKTDSAFGVTVIYFLVTGITWQMALSLFLINSTAHAAIAFALVQLRIKANF
jgi:CDP-diacylglycerol--serine O-phosphatidyltransferase